MVDVLCATKGERRPAGLENLPFDWEYFEDRSSHWGKAANNLLDLAAERGNDAIFLDDDVEILPTTFDSFLPHQDAAEVFGFSLLGPALNGVGIQSSGTILVMAKGDLILGSLDHEIIGMTIPVYLAHVGTCLCYIKKEVLKSGVRFPIWGGMHFEDAAFCYDVWRNGFRCLRLPSVGIHHGAPNGAGITKGNDPMFVIKRDINFRAFREWIEETGLVADCQAKKVPLGFFPVWLWEKYQEEREMRI